MVSSFHFKVGTIASLMLLLFAFRTLSPLPWLSPPRLRFGRARRHTRISTILFFERPLQPILTRDHREKSSKRSPTVALRYDEPRAAHQATLCLSEAGTPHEKIRLYVRSKVGEVGILPAVCVQLESPRATIASSYEQ
jgi:hypothetical protein